MVEYLLIGTTVTGFVFIGIGADFYETMDDRLAFNLCYLGISFLFFSLLLFVANKVKQLVDQNNAFEDEKKPLVIQQETTV